MDGSVGCRYGRSGNVENHHVFQHTLFDITLFCVLIEASAKK